MAKNKILKPTSQKIVDDKGEPILNETEEKALLVHFGEDHYDYLTNEEMDKFLIKVSQEFEKTRFNPAIVYARRKLRFHYIHLVDMLPYEQFKDNYDKMFKEAKELFENYLEEFNEK